MASTYSTNLAIELIGTGEQSGTWGTTTNTNLGTLIEQSISGYVTQAITDGSGANTTITIPNGATGVARNMYIEMTGALSFSTTSLIVPANKKLYFIFNNTSGGFAVTVKVSGQTGVLVPNGKKVILTSNGTDIVEAANQVVGAFGVGGTATMAAINASGLVAMAGAATVGTTLGVTGAFTGTTGTFTKAAAGDVLVLTNGGATPKPMYFYSDASTMSMGTSASQGGSLLAFVSTTSAQINISGGSIQSWTTAGTSVTGSLDVTGATTIGAASAGVGTLTINHAVQPTLSLAKTNATATTWQIYNNGNLVFYDGTNTPLYFVGADSVFSSTGFVKINGAGSNGLVSILGRSAVSGLYVQRSNTAASFTVDDDGNIYAGQIGASTGTALILSGGYIKTLTSSRRYKKDEEPIDIGLDFINTLNPIKFRLKENDLPQVGFIAEDFPDERLVDMSYIDIENKELGMRPESVHYSQITAPLVKAVQELSAKVAALEAAR